MGLDEAIDAARARRLAAAGWTVERDRCAPATSPKNGLILARPSAVAAVEPRPLYPSRFLRCRSGGGGLTAIVSVFQFLVCYC